MAYIRYMNNQNGAVYASVVGGIRDGKVVRQKHIVSLVCVVDREQGIYQNRDRDVYRFSLKDGYSDVPHLFFSAICRHFRFMMYFKTPCPLIWTANICSRMQGSRASALVNALRSLGGGIQRHFLRIILQPFTGKTMDHPIIRSAG